jgi:hypothetical protein
VVILRLYLMVLRRILENGEDYFVLGFTMMILVFYPRGTKVVIYENGEEY